nr:MAG: hypothetical protein 3 [Leviviridae sp.]
MISLTALWRELAVESASWCGTSADFDCKTVEARVEVEGESFLTITLPKFGKAFERSLELGFLDYSLFSGFLRRGRLPVFLRGFVSQIFDTQGTLLNEPSIDCIRAVRELTLAFGKIERMCSDTRVSHAMRRFVEIEAELEEIDTSKLKEFLPQFRKLSTLLWADTFANVENLLNGTDQLKDLWMAAEGDENHRTMRHSGDPDRGVDPLDVILGLPHRGTSVSRGFRKEKGKLLVDCEIVDPAGRSSFLVPRHGPGATADRLRGNAKFSVSQWPLRLESVFPYGDYALPSWRYYNQLDRVQFLDPGAEVAVKVTPVPKTDKTPRIIAEEPTAVQYCQQALFHQIVDGIENGSKFLPPLGGKSCNLGGWFVGFQDQETNRFLAMKGSHDGSLATLDLSEASDRVLNEHVLLLFERFPLLSEAIQATRSTKARVPGHGVIPLLKFASMGSALCFPVEAMVFSTIVLTAIAIERRVPIDRAFLIEMRGQVRVYGDDIIVPVDCVQRVIQLLELFGLKVNMDKSFWNGKFRESCGGDYYAGEWVTPVRLRHELPRSLEDVGEVVGLVAFRNLLYWGGYWKTAARLDDEIRVLFRGTYPIVAATSEALGRESALPYRTEYFGKGLHDKRVKAYVVRYKTPKSPITGEGALLKFFLKPGILPSQDAHHLERSGRPIAARIKRRGTSPF